MQYLISSIAIKVRNIPRDKEGNLSDMVLPKNADHTIDRMYDQQGTLKTKT